MEGDNVQLSFPASVFEATHLYISTNDIAFPLVVLAEQVFKV